MYDYDLRLALNIVAGTISEEDAIKEKSTGATFSPQGYRDLLDTLEEWRKDFKVAKKWAVETLINKIEDCQNNISTLERKIDNG